MLAKTGALNSRLRSCRRGCSGPSGCRSPWESVRREVGSVYVHHGDAALGPAATGRRVVVRGFVRGYSHRLAHAERKGVR